MNVLYDIAFPIGISSNLVENQAEGHNCVLMIDIHKMTVLIVDDMISMCKSIRSMMRVIEYGKEFFFANNGKEALKILQEEPIDLVLLD